MKRWLSSSRLAGFYGRTKTEAGYTITEVMVVLAVTTMLFAAAVIAFSGRQARIEFNQSVRAYEAMLQNIISDVSKGHYYSDGFECLVDAGGTPYIQANTTSKTGTNGSCIFLGKALEPQGVNSVTHVLIGNRRPSNSSGVSRDSDGFVGEILGDGVPSVALSKISTAPQFKTSTNHSFQLKVNKVVSVLDSTKEIKLLTFTNSNSSPSTFLESELRNIEITGFKDTFISGTDGKLTKDKYVLMGDMLVSFTPPLKTLSSEGVLFCLEGANGQRAEIRLGDSDSPVNISSTLDTVAGGVCP